VVASGGKLCSSCAMRWVKYDSNLRRAQPMHSGLVRGRGGVRARARARVRVRVRVRARARVRVKGLTRSRCARR